MKIVLLTALVLTTCPSVEKTVNVNSQKVEERPPIVSNRVLPEKPSTSSPSNSGGFLPDQTVKLGEKFVLKKDETAKIKNTDLEVKNPSVGYTISEEADHEMFCSFSLDFKGESERKTLSYNRSVAFKSFRVKLVSLDGNKNTCGFVVTKKNR